MFRLWNWFNYFNRFSVFIACLHPMQVAKILFRLFAWLVSGRLLMSLLRNPLKGNLFPNDHFDGLYFQNGKCNAKYFCHCKFLTKNGIDLQKFNILDWEIKKISNKNVFYDLFSHFYSWIIVFSQSELNSIVSE